MWKWPSIIILVLATAMCGRQKPIFSTAEREDTDAKRMLQGIWRDAESDEVIFRVVGDTIYYPDTTSMPAAFRIVSDSLILGSENTKYLIEKQSPHIFWFHNQTGYLVKLVRSDDPADSVLFTRSKEPAFIITQPTSADTVIMWSNERYHAYVNITPTTFKVVKQSYNSDGVAVDNIYYDNTVYLGIYKGKTKIYSHDFRKQQFQDIVPPEFLRGALLNNMRYDKSDASGMQFVLYVCEPDGVSCYAVRITVDGHGHMSQTLEKYQ